MQEQKLGAKAIVAACMSRKIEPRIDLKVLTRGSATEF